MPTQLGLHHAQNIKLSLKLLLYTNLYHLQLHLKACVQVSSIMSEYQRPIKCNMYFQFPVVLLEYFPGTKQTFLYQFNHPRILSISASPNGLPYTMSVKSLIKPGNFIKAAKISTIYIKRFKNLQV